MSGLQWVLHGAGVFGMSYFVMRFLIIHLAKSGEVSYVRTLWFYSSLLFTITLFALPYLEAHGASANPEGWAGKVAVYLAKLMLDIGSSLTFFGGLFALMVLPQLMSYVFCAIFGCAGSPSYIGVGFDIFFISVLKTFAGAAGFLPALAIHAVRYQWVSGNTPYILAACEFAVVLMVLSFVLVYFYLELHSLKEQVLKILPRRVARVLFKIHNWARRNVGREKKHQHPITWFLDAASLRDLGVHVSAKNSSTRVNIKLRDSETE